MADRKRRIDLSDAQEKKHKQEVNPWTNVGYSEKYYSILEKRLKLPVYQFKEKLLEAVDQNQIVVVEGETGSGKTTQIPQFLVEAGYANQGQSLVACTVSLYRHHYCVLHCCRNIF